MSQYSRENLVDVPPPAAPEDADKEKRLFREYGRVELNDVQFCGALVDSKEYENPKFTMSGAGSLRFWARFVVSRWYLDLERMTWEKEDILLSCQGNGVFAEILHKQRCKHLNVIVSGSLAQFSMKDNAGATRRFCFVRAKSLMVCEPFTVYCNRVSVIGVICRTPFDNPKVIVGGNGVLIALLRVAVREYIRGGPRRGEYEYVFLTVRCVGALAELVQRYGAQGRDVLIYGQLTNYNTETEGGRRVDLEVLADWVLFLDRRIPDGPDQEIRNPLGMRGADERGERDLSKHHNRPGPEIIKGGAKLRRFGYDVDILDVQQRDVSGDSREVDA